MALSKVTTIICGTSSGSIPFGISALPHRQVGAGHVVAVHGGAGQTCSFGLIVVVRCARSREIIFQLKVKHDEHLRAEIGLTSLSNYLRETSVTHRKDENIRCRRSLGEVV